MSQHTDNPSAKHPTKKAGNTLVVTVQQFFAMGCGRGPQLTRFEQTRLVGPGSWIASTRRKKKERKGEKKERESPGKKDIQPLLSLSALFLLVLCERKKPSYNYISSTDRAIHPSVILLPLLLPPLQSVIFCVGLPSFPGSSSSVSRFVTWLCVYVSHSHLNLSNLLKITGLQPLPHSLHRNGGFGLLQHPRRAKPADELRVGNFGLWTFFHVLHTNDTAPFFAGFQVRILICSAVEHVSPRLP